MEELLIVEQSVLDLDDAIHIIKSSKSNSNDLFIQALKEIRDNNRVSPTRLTKAIITLKNALHQCILDKDYTQIKDLLIPFLEPFILKKYGYDSSLTERCQNVLLYLFFFCINKELVPLFYSFLHDQDRYFLLEIGFCLYYILHHYEVVGQIHSTLYSIHESDPAATPSSKKILIEEIEESPFSKITPPSKQIEKGKEIVLQSNLTSLLPQLRNQLIQESTKQCYSTRMMTVYMDVFNGMFKLWIERTKDEYEKCLEEWSGLLHANDSSLQTKAWDYIHLASKRAKTMDSHDQQALESMEQLIDYLNTLLAWSKEEKKRECRMQGIQITLDSIHAYLDKYHKNMVLYYQTIACIEELDRNGGNLSTFLSSLCSLIYNNKLYLLILVKELEILIDSYAIIQYKTSTEELSSLLPLLEQPFQQDPNESDQDYLYKVYLYSLFYRKMINIYGDLTAKDQQQFLMTHRQSFYQICMTSLTIQVPPQDPELYLLSIYPITTFLFSLNILPEESFLQNPSPLLTFLKQKDSVSDAIVSLFSTLCSHHPSSILPFLLTQFNLLAKHSDLPLEGSQTEEEILAQIQPESTSSPASSSWISTLPLEDQHLYTNILAILCRFFQQLDHPSEELTKTISPYLFDLLLDPFVHTQLSFKQIFTYLVPSLVLPALYQQYEDLQQSPLLASYKSLLYEIVLNILLEQPDLVSIVQILYSLCKEREEKDPLFAHIQNVLRRYIQLEKDTNKYTPLSSYLWTEYTKEPSNIHCFIFIKIFFSVLSSSFFPLLYPLLQSNYQSDESLSDAQLLAPFLLFHLYSPTQLQELLPIEGPSSPIDEIFDSPSLSYSSLFSLYSPSTNPNVNLFHYLAIFSLYLYKYMHKQQIATFIAECISLLPSSFLFPFLTLQCHFFSSSDLSSSQSFFIQLLESNGWNIPPNSSKMDDSLLSHRYLFYILQNHFLYYSPSIHTNPALSSRFYSLLCSYYTAMTKNTSSQANHLLQSVTHTLSSFLWTEMVSIPSSQLDAYREEYINQSPSLTTADSTEKETKNSLLELFQISNPTPPSKPLIEVIEETSSNSTSLKEIHSPFFFQSISILQSPCSPLQIFILNGLDLLLSKLDSAPVFYIYTHLSSLIVSWTVSNEINNEQILFPLFHITMQLILKTEYVHPLFDPRFFNSILHRSLLESIHDSAIQLVALLLCFHPLYLTTLRPADYQLLKQSLSVPSRHPSLNKLTALLSTILDL